MTHVMTRRSLARVAGVALGAILSAETARGQVVSERGFVDAGGTGFFSEAVNDPERLVGDVLAREEVTIRPASWVQFTAGVDFRANSHDQVEDEWRLDLDDRTILRPRLALRRLAASFSAGGFTLDIGKQFIRWGRVDVIYPTDRFAPRDYLNVLDADVLPVIAARPSLQVGSETFEAVVTLQPTPSRLPLFYQRWTPLSEAGRTLPLDDAGSVLPDNRQYGIRWRHTGPQLETALSYFDGANHLPNVETHLLPSGALQFLRVFPTIRMVGGDLAIPTSWLTWKFEAAYVTAPAHDTEEYALYVIEVERQIGEWLLDVGYAGDRTTKAYPVPTFSPDRGMAQSIIGHASFTVDPRRTVLFEGAVRQNGDGVFAKAEYSQAFGQHIRLNLTGIAIAGQPDDFIGQYRDNSNVSIGFRVSF
jgi:hypothetical protein